MESREVSRTHPFPQRFPPAVMAALMAAVSSVTPSPIFPKAVSTAVYRQHEGKENGDLTNSAIVLHIAKDGIPRPSIGSQTLVGNFAHPKVGMDGQKEAGKRQEHMEQGTHGQKGGGVCQPVGVLDREKKRASSQKRNNQFNGVYPMDEEEQGIQTLNKKEGGEGKVQTNYGMNRPPPTTYESQGWYNRVEEAQARKKKSNTAK